MDYEKKYKEALNRAKHALDCDRNGLVRTDKSLIFSIFPELAESEDERIRKYLLKLANRCPEDSIDFMGEVKKEDILAWLEKQAEQKPSGYNHLAERAEAEVTTDGPTEELRYTDYELKHMSMEEANKKLTPNGWNMRRWCELRNIGANHYSCYSGQIKKVEPGGWWY